LARLIHLLGIGSSLATIFVFIGGSLSASVGIGGGGVFVPIFVLICGLQPKEAIPLSKVCILGGAISTFAVNLRKRHPKADRPLIDYSIALIMAPPTILGTVVGVMLYVVFPQWLVLILLVLVLVTTDYRTWSKAVELYKKESASNIPKQQIQSAETGHLNRKPSDYFPSDSNSHTIARVDAVDNAIFRMSRIPLHKIMLLLFVYLVTFLLVYVRGGGKSNSDISPFGIVKCSLEFWAFSVAIVVILMSVSFVGAYTHHKRNDILNKAGIPPVEGDIAWSLLIYIGFMSVGLFAGTCAGFLGIGSGMINVPFMLEMGLQPEVAAATSSFIIIFTAMSTVLQYLMIDALPFYSGLWFGTTGILAAVVGQFVVGYVVKKYKKSSIISFILATVIGASAIGMTVMEILRIIDKAHGSNPNFGFNPYCSFSNSTD
jgi:uncharacterized membrane protein YfcA